MSTDGTRAVLEGVAYGDDPAVRPGDRLRAIEMLAALEERERQQTAEQERVGSLDLPDPDGVIACFLGRLDPADPKPGSGLQFFPESYQVLAAYCTEWQRRHGLVDEELGRAQQEAEVRPGD